MFSTWSEKDRKPTLFTRDGKGTPMYGICHWEIFTDDLEKGTSVYKELFGWTIEPWMEGYAGIKTGEGQIGGGLAKMDKPGVTLYVEVPDIEAMLAKAQGLGATVAVPKTALPNDMGAFAVFQAPNGTQIGIWAKS